MSKLFDYKEWLPPNRGMRIPTTLIPAISTVEQGNDPVFPTIEDFRREMKSPPLLKFQKATVDLSTDIPESVPVLKQGDYVIFSRGDISTIGGKAKSRKTFLVVLLASEFLMSNDAGKILIVDTEMSKSRTYKTVRRIHRKIGWDPGMSDDRLTVLSLREYAPNERADILKEAIEHLKPDLVFLDGIRDIVKDFNNIEESARIVGMLMKLSTKHNCHICCVLHENRVNDQLRGHLGSEIINKSETVLSIAKNGDTSKVEPAFTRDMPFEAFWFCINNEELPEYCDEPVTQVKTDKLHTLFESILPDKKRLSYSDLRSKVMEAAGVKQSAAQNKIKDAADLGIIIKTQKGVYYCPSQAGDDDTVFS